MTTVEQDNTGSTTTVEEMPHVVVPKPQTLESAAVGAEKDNDREYVVFKRHTASSPNAPQMWEFIVNIKATSAPQATRLAAEQPGLSFLNTDGPTTLVAIPARSFNPVTLTVKTETTIVIT